MSTKQNTGAFDCHANALPDEEMFILLARDERAPWLVEEWARRRALDITLGRKPESDQAMVAEAFECAKRMRAWRKANDGRWRQPATHFVHYNGAAVMVKEAAFFAAQGGHAEPWGKPWRPVTVPGLDPRTVEAIEAARRIGQSMLAEGRL